MASIRPLLFSLVLPLVACGGGDEGTPTPEGMHYTYVASQVLVPTNNNEAREYGLDIGGSDSNEPDGTVDNQLGMVLGTLASQGFEVQGAIDEAVADGSIILLADFQTTSFSSAGGAGLSIKLGDKATAMPAPCTDPANITTCGQHLKGTGTFTVASTSPMNAIVVGKVAGGTFTGGPGEISLQIALAGSPLTLDLKGARAKATGMSDTAMQSIILGGSVLKTDIDTKVIPAIHGQIVPLIQRDCTSTTPPDCGCATGSTGKTILGLFDTAPKDCTVTVDEIRNNALIASLLAPDVCSTDSCAAPDALSIGLKASAVKGSFPTPAE